MQSLGGFLPITEDGTITGIINEPDVSVAASDMNFLLFILSDLIWLSRYVITINITNLI